MMDIDVRFYAAVFLRRLPYFIAIVATVSLVAIAIAYLTPRVYRASARILLEAPQVSTNVAASAVPANPIEQLQIVQEKVTTRDNLLALAHKFHMYEDSQERLSASDMVQDMRERLSFEQLQLDAPGGGGATVFEVSFKASDPKLAADLVNSVVALVLSKDLDQRTDRAANATRFFGDEAARLGLELRRLESEILKFKNEHVDALPDGLEFRRTRQGALEERLLMLDREQGELRSRRTRLVQIYAATGQVSGSPASTPEQQQLQDLNRALAEQLAIFAENSPTVVALRARIADLRKDLEANRPGGSKPKDGVSELDLQLSDIDERLGQIEKERSSITQEIADLAKLIKAAPANETVLGALERDRLNIQTQYNAAVASLAEASAGEQIEILSKGPRFTLVEPAAPPQYPISPQRRRIAALGGVAGIGLGVGFIVLLELLNKTVRRPVDIVRIFDALPLATIPHIYTKSEIRRARAKRALAVLVATGAAAAVLLAVHHYYMPLDLVLDRLRAA
jgi:polysaccharide biosynthesis transport protein